MNSNDHEKYFGLENTHSYRNCEAQARVRKGWARDGPQGKRPQSLNPCLRLTLNIMSKETRYTMYFIAFMMSVKMHKYKRLTIY